MNLRSRLRSTNRTTLAVLVSGLMILTYARRAGWSPEALTGMLVALAGVLAQLGSLFPKSDYPEKAASTPPETKS